jgi:hypothetical protein
MGADLFGKTTNTTANNITQSNASVTATPYGNSVKPWNGLLGRVNNQVKAPYFNEDSQQGYGMLRSLAGQPVQGLDQANGFLSGLFQQAQAPVDMNPYQNQVVNPMAQKATASALSQASMSGRYGSNASTQNVAQNVTDAVMPYMSQEWNNAQARHTANQGLAMQGMGILPMLQQMRMLPAQTLLQSGQMQDQSIQDRLEELCLHPRGGGSAGRHQDIDGNDHRQPDGNAEHAVLHHAGHRRGRGADRLSVEPRQVRRQPVSLVRGGANGITQFTPRRRYVGGRKRGPWDLGPVGSGSFGQFRRSVGLCLRRAGRHDPGQALGYAGSAAARRAGG